MNVTRSEFLKPLLDYEANSLLTGDELDLIFEDYELIEKAWQHNFKKINKLKLLILGEAPLSFKQYIYNEENSNNTNFFYWKHLDAINQTLGIDVNIKDKKSFLTELSNLGVLFLDFFPYPLNQNMGINYSKLLKNNKNHFIKAKDLFYKTIIWHLEPKLSQIRERHSNFKMAFRYSRNYHFYLKLDNPSILKDKIISIHKDQNDLNLPSLINIFSENLAN